MDIDTADLSQKIVDAIDYIYEELMVRHPGVNFTIKKKMYNSNAITFTVHDENVFFDQKFQEWAFSELPKTYLYPKKILNVFFTFKKQ